MRKLNAILLITAALALAVPASAGQRNREDGPVTRAWNKLVRLLEGPMIPPPTGTAEPQSPPPTAQAEPQSPPPGQGQ
jgi:hypothetical protein